MRQISLDFPLGGRCRLGDAGRESFPNLYGFLYRALYSSAVNWVRLEKEEILMKILSFLPRNVRFVGYNRPT